MVNYFRYFPTSEKDELWGLTVLNAGCTKIEPHASYPSAVHPPDHYFNWDTGRTLQEYQLIYITRGSGIFESANCKAEVPEGSVILLHPGERHRYMPHKNTGWYEYWVGFKGDFMLNILAGNYFAPDTPIYHIGFNEIMVGLFQDIIRFSREERTGYQPAISGAIIYLLGLLHSENEQNAMLRKDIIEQTVNKARAIFRDKIYENLSQEQVANELNVGYSWFRKVFKEYTGLAPGQYLIQLKIQKSKELLADPAKSVKEIALDLHIDSPVYFSKLFKKKVGLTPLEYRDQILKRHRF